MDFSCSRDDLIKGVQAVERIVSTKSTLPIIGNILFEAKKSGLMLSANNLEIGIEINVPAKIQKEGSILIPAKTLGGIVSKLPSGDVLFKVSEKNIVKISYKESHFTIHGLASDEFPSLPKVKDGKSLELDAAVLFEMVKQTIFSVSSSEEKYVLNGVLFEVGKSDLPGDTSDIRLVATDGYRLARRGAKIGAKGVGEIKSIIPAKALAEVNRVIQDANGEKVEIVITPDQAAFRHGGVYIVSRLIQGQFPDYKQVIPKNSESKLIASSKELQNASERAAVIAAGNANIVKFEAKSGNLHIIANTPDVGSIDEIVKVETKGKEKAAIAFNVRLIIDVMKNLTTEKVALELSGPLSPGVITPVEGEDYVYIVMPIRTAESAA
jgi:DNA polymerase-3 subunit beta